MTGYPSAWGPRKVRPEAVSAACPGQEASAVGIPSGGTFSTFSPGTLRRTMLTWSVVNFGEWAGISALASVAVSLQSRGAEQ